MLTARVSQRAPLRHVHDGREEADGHGAAFILRCRGALRCVGCASAQRTDHLWVELTLQRHILVGGGRVPPNGLVETLVHLLGLRSMRSSFACLACPSIPGAREQEQAPHFNGVPDANAPVHPCALARATFSATPCVPCATAFGGVVERGGARAGGGQKDAAFLRWRCARAPLGRPDSWHPPPWRGGSPPVTPYGVGRPRAGAICGSTRREPASQATAEGGPVAIAASSRRFLWPRTCSETFAIQPQKWESGRFRAAVRMQLAKRVPVRAKPARGHRWRRAVGSIVRSATALQFQFAYQPAAAAAGAAAEARLGLNGGVPGFALVGWLARAGVAPSALRAGCSLAPSAPGGGVAGSRGRGLRPKGTLASSSTGRSLAS